MAIDEHLPRPLDSLLLCPNGSADTDLSFLKTDKFDSLYASGFKRAGDAISHLYEDTHEWFKEPELFMPALHSYRHFIELTLKSQIKAGVGWNLIAPAEHDMLSHNLLRLWNMAKPIVQAVWKTCEPSVLDAVGRIILELHAIDPSGQNMRYASDTKGHHTLEHVPEMVSLGCIRTIMQRVWEFFQELENKWQGYFCENWSSGMQERLITPGAMKLGLA